MIKKDIISSNITYLLNSALTRSTHQGVTVYEAALKKVQDAHTEKEMNDILEKLNSALIGIEAHGQFTDDEYEVVQELRTLQA